MKIYNVENWELAELIASLGKIMKWGFAQCCPTVLNKKKSLLPQVDTM